VKKAIFALRVYFYNVVLYIFLKFRIIFVVSCLFS